MSIIFMENENGKNLVLSNKNSLELFSLLFLSPIRSTSRNGMGMDLAGSGWKLKIGLWNVILVWVFTIAQSKHYDTTLQYYTPLNPLLIEGIC